MLNRIEVWVKGVDRWLGDKMGYCCQVNVGGTVINALLILIEYVEYLYECGKLIIVQVQ